MNPVCILTDSTAQFVKPTFPGRKHIHMMEMHSTAAQPVSTVPSKLYPANHSIHSIYRDQQKILAPSVQEFRQTYLDLAQTNHEIVVLLHSSHLSQSFHNAVEAADTVRGRVQIQVIDSATISVGLGYLVQEAANAAVVNPRSIEIERILRGLIPHIYSVFCIPGLSYLYHAGFLSNAQAVIGEMLGLLPVFTLEDGRLTPLEKVRNSRHLTDFLQEFLDEFSHLHQIALIQGSPILLSEARILREHAALNFPKTPFNELALCPSVATLFGPRSLAMFAIEATEE